MITLMKTLLLAGALAVATASAAYAGGVDGGVLGDGKAAHGDGKAAHGDGKAAHPGSHHPIGNSTPRRSQQRGAEAHENCCPGARLPHLFSILYGRRSSLVI